MLLKNKAPHEVCDVSQNDSSLLLPLITTEMSEEDFVLLVMVGGVSFIILIQVYDVLVDGLIANCPTLYI